MRGKPTILKPDLNPYFKALPMPYSIILRDQYNQARTREQLTDLCHYWLNSREKAITPRTCYLSHEKHTRIFTHTTNKLFQPGGAYFFHK